MLVHSQVELRRQRKGRARGAGRNRLGASVRLLLRVVSLCSTSLPLSPAFSHAQFLSLPGEPARSCPAFSRRVLASLPSPSSEENVPRLPRCACSRAGRTYEGRPGGRAARRRRASWPRRACRLASSSTSSSPRPAAYDPGGCACARSQRCYILLPIDPTAGVVTHSIHGGDNPARYRY